MICPNCGRETPDGMAFCLNCGSKLAAPSQAQQAAEQAQREAQARAEQAQREAQAQAQRAAQQAQAPQYGQQQYGPQQYGPQQYDPQQYNQQQYGPQYNQQYQAPPQPKQPSKFDKLLTGEPPFVLDFYLKYYNTFLAVGSMISLAFIGIVFAVIWNSAGWMLPLFFLAGLTFCSAVFAQIMLSSKKSLGWIMTFVAGGLRWFMLLVQMIGLFALGDRIYGDSTSLILYNCFYSIVALMLHGALLAFAVIVFIKNKDKFR